MGAERKSNAAKNALEEARSLLEQADRSRRQLEQDLSDTNEQLADATNTNQALSAAKTKLENEVNNMNADLDEKAARAMIDAARLAEELRVEQDLAAQLDRDKK